MLQRSTQIGEFYRMSPPAGLERPGALPSSYMDIMIYDEEKDQHVHVTFREALYAAGVGAADAPATTGRSTLAGEHPRRRALNKTVVATRSGAVAQGPAGGSWGCWCGPGLPHLYAWPPDPENMIATVAKGVWLPIEIVIARPFIEHLAMSAIMCVSGRDTGATLFGPGRHADLCQHVGEDHRGALYMPHEIGHHARRRTSWCCATSCFRATWPAATPRWLGQEFAGEGSKYTLTGPLTGNQVTEGITKRLSIDRRRLGRVRVDDRVCGAVRRRQQARPGHLALAPPASVGGDASVGQQQGILPGRQRGFKLYDHRYNLGQIHFGEDVRAAENMEFISQGSVNNALCFLGPHRKYSPFTANFYELTPGQGHLGPDAIPGDARWRRGESVSLNAARNSMVSLEVAAHSPAGHDAPGAAVKKKGERGVKTGREWSWGVVENNTKIEFADTDLSYNGS